MKLHPFNLDDLNPVDLELFIRSVWENLQIENAVNPAEIDECQAKWAVIFPTMCELELVTSRLEFGRTKEIHKEAKNGADFDRLRKSDDTWFMAQMAENACDRMKDFNIAMQAKMKNFEAQWNRPAGPTGKPTADDEPPF